LSNDLNRSKIPSYYSALLPYDDVLILNDMAELSENKIKNSTGLNVNKLDKSDSILEMEY